jgi:hypothetical protein|tara:strand:- start:1322 stop:1762 length:441 start_codon:yes stop_codon:yes gene_type:complete
MKKILTLLLTIPFLGFSSDSDLFKVDQKKVDSYMINIEEIESLVQQNNNDYLATYDLNPQLFDNSNLNTTLNFSLVYGDPPLGIPSFVWGLCCGVSGLAVVYFVADDKEETKKALYGCATSTVIGSIVYFAAFATAAATTSNLYYY